MGPHYRASHEHRSLAQHDIVHAVHAVERLIRTRLPSVGEYVLLSLLWGFVLYLVLAAAE